MTVRNHVLRLLTVAPMLALALAGPMTLAGCKDNSASQAEAHDAQGLMTLLDRADAAIADDDMQTLFEISTPEPMMDAILESQGLTSAEEKATTRAMMETMLLGMFEQIDITSHEADRDAIRYVETQSGATVAYVPVVTRMNVAGSDLTSTGEYVGLQRDGEWFLLTPSDTNTIAMMKAAFPELADQDIQPNTLQ